MNYYAKVNTENIVEAVLVMDESFAETMRNLEPNFKFIQTDPDTRRNQHLKGGIPLRKNYAGIGYTYNSVLDAFIPNKRWNTWILDNEIGDWVSPVPYPEPEFPDKYRYDDTNAQWVLNPEYQG